MSTILDPVVTYGTITWSLDLAGPDSADPDDNPDRQDPGATVTFTPSVPWLLFPTAKKIIMPVAVPIEAPGGDYSVKLVATDNPAAQTVDWHWTVTVAVPGQSTWEFPIHVPAGQTVDLSEVAEVQTTEAATIIRGPQGDPGPKGDKGDKGDPGGLPDTGWRDISADLGDGWSGDLRIRRIGDVVYLAPGLMGGTGEGSLNANVVHPIEPINHDVTVLPEGFRPAVLVGLDGWSVGVLPSGLISTEFGNGAALPSPLGESWQWTTGQAWPAVLPGVPWEA